MDARGIGKQKQRTDEVDSDAPPRTAAEADAHASLSPFWMETGGFSFPGTPPRRQAPSPPAAALLLRPRSAGNLMDKNQFHTEQRSEFSLAEFHTERRGGFSVSDNDACTDVDLLPRPRPCPIGSERHVIELIKGLFHPEPCGETGGFSFTDYRALPSSSSSASNDGDFYDRSARVFSPSLCTAPKDPSSTVTPEAWRASASLSARAATVEVDSNLAEHIRNLSAALAPQPDSGYRGWKPLGAAATDTDKTGAGTTETSERVASPPPVHQGHGGHAFGNGGAETGASPSKFKAESSATGAESVASSAQAPKQLVLYDTELPPMGGHGAAAAAPYSWAPIPYSNVPNWPQPMGRLDAIASSSSAVPYQSLGWGGGKLTPYKQGHRKAEHCIHWTCQFEDRCLFMHAGQELLPAARHRLNHIQLCEYAQAGLPCPYGYTCPFLH